MDKSAATRTKSAPQQFTRAISDPEPKESNRRTNQLRCQSATSLKHARSTEDFSKSPHSSPRLSVRRCSLQYHQTAIPDKRLGSGSLSLDRKHHASTSTLSRSKDKGLHGSFHSISLKKDKGQHGSHSSIKHIEKDRFNSEPRGSIHTDKKPHLWHPRKVSSVTKPKLGHKRYGSHAAAEKIAKLRRAKEDEALEKLRKKSSINATWLTSSRYPLLSMFGSVVAKKCKNCCCTIS